MKKGKKFAPKSILTWLYLDFKAYLALSKFQSMNLADSKVNLPAASEVAVLVFMVLSVFKEVWFKIF